MNATKLKFADMPTGYTALVAMHPPRPIHDDVDEQNTEEIVLELAGHDLSPDQDDYLELLSDLLLKYQSQQRPRRAAPRRRPHERLKYLLAQSEMPPAKLAKLLGCSQPLVSMLLSGKRNLTTDNLKTLAAHFKLDAGYFL
jgi:HTH-type transcriptional regulator/antitoxin HigA